VLKILMYISQRINLKMDLKIKKMLKMLKTLKYK